MSALERAVEAIEDITEWAVRGNEQLKVWDGMLKKSENGGKIAENPADERNGRAEAKSGSGNME